MTSLASKLDDALRSGDFDPLADAEPLQERDRLETLLAIYDLFLAPIETLDGREQFQYHPTVTRLKNFCEEWLRATLDVRLGAKQPQPVEVGTALRRVARRSNDSVYEWLAQSADWHQLVTFLAIEGGPDGGFDDMVALCQIGIRGSAKVVLGANYWDEMGCGDVDAVHTVLHDQHVEAMALPRIPRDRLPVEALYRMALGGLLATNRSLQPEMLGALGLLELQAGPRSRQVVRALKRLNAPAAALPFYEVHAETDPRHGKEWLDGVVRPLVDEHPEWGDRIIRGAMWRSDVNARLFGKLHTLLATRELQSA